MDDNAIEITVGGNPGRAMADAADHVALALMTAGAAVDFPGRPQRESRSSQTLRGVRAVVRTAGRAGRGTSAASGRGGWGLAASAKVAVGVVLMLALFDAELRLHFGLRLDTIITAAVIWWFWRWYQRGGAVAGPAPG